MKLIRIAYTRTFRRNKLQGQGLCDEEEDFSVEDRKEYIYAKFVRVNVFMAIKELVLAMRKVVH